MMSTRFLVSVMLSCLALAFAFPVLNSYTLFAQGAATQVAESETGEKEEGDTNDDAEADEDDDDHESKPVELNGVFQAAQAEVIQLDLQEWSSVKVREAVAHGDKVVAGDVLIRLETDKLDEAIVDAEQDIRIDELALRGSEIKLEMAQRNQDLALKVAEVNDRIATEDLKDYLTDGRDRRVRSLERSVDSARNRLEYQAEELKQLEQMYAADDLTEETEEIILKRTRDAVKSAQFALESVINIQRKGGDFDIPRTEEQLEQAVARAALALEELRRETPQSLERQELEFAKDRVDLEKKRERLERLRADRKLMMVIAPRSGIVYYGSQRRGKWSDPSSIETMMQPGGSPKVRTDLMTIVELRPLVVHVSVPEDVVGQVQAGVMATVAPVAYPEMSLPARVVGRSMIPVADGQFDATFELLDGDLDEGIVPGMKAKVTLGASATTDD